MKRLNNNPNWPSKVRARELLDALKSKPCTDCGGRFPPCVMEFDHVRGRKVRPVGNMKYLRKERLLAEIKKCDLVCANCHRIRTFNRGWKGGRISLQTSARPPSAVTDNRYPEKR